MRWAHGDGVSEAEEPSSASEMIAFKLDGRGEPGRGGGAGPLAEAQRSSGVLGWYQPGSRANLSGGRDGLAWPGLGCSAGAWEGDGGGGMGARGVCGVPLAVTRLAQADVWQLNRAASPSVREAVVRTCAHHHSVNSPSPGGRVRAPVIHCSAMARVPT